MPAVSAKFYIQILEWFGCALKAFPSTELGQCTVLKNPTDKTSHYFQPAHSTFSLNASVFLGCVSSMGTEICGTTVFTIISVNNSDTNDKCGVLTTMYVRFFGS